MDQTINIKEAFKKNKLIPAIVQDASTKEVLMLAYMNEESFLLTAQTKQTWFFSRSRQKLWNKGETSGHIQNVVSWFFDCDNDTILLLVNQIGPACHTGKKSCFFNKICL